MARTAARRTRNSTTTCRRCRCAPTGWRRSSEGLHVRPARAQQVELAVADLDHVGGLERIATVGEAVELAFDGVEIAQGAQRVADRRALLRELIGRAGDLGAPHRLGV